MTEEQRYNTITWFFHVMDDVRERAFSYTPSIVPSDGELLQLVDMLGDAARLLRALGIEPPDGYDWVPQRWDLTLVEVIGAVNSAQMYGDSIEGAPGPHAGWILEDIESARRALTNLVEQREET